jgi:hypothetical protein
MDSTLTKPGFEEHVGTIVLPYSNLVFSTKRVGVKSFSDLRNADYGKGFHMSTMPELIPLIYFTFKNQEQEEAKNLIKIFKNEWFPANTGVYYYPQGIFVQDSPQMENKKIIPFDYKALEGKLGKHEERGVVFSDDKTLRFTPYGFKVGTQNSVELANNRGIIALTNGEENAEKLAIASQYYQVDPVLLLSSTDNLQDNIKTRIVCLGTDTLEDWISIGAIDSESEGNYWGSFGAKNIN